MQIRENMPKVCLFYSQNNKIVGLSNTTDMAVWEIDEVRKGIWALISWLCFLGVDWLGSKLRSRGVYWVISGRGWVKESTAERQGEGKQLLKWPSPIIPSAPKCSIFWVIFVIRVPSKSPIVFSTQEPFYNPPNYSSWCLDIFVLILGNLINREGVLRRTH